jgi:hypothetical protein
MLNLHFFQLINVAHIKLLQVLTKLVGERVVLVIVSDCSFWTGYKSVIDTKNKDCKQPRYHKRTRSWQKIQVFYYNFKLGL